MTVKSAFSISILNSFLKLVFLTFKYSFTPKTVKMKKPTKCP